MSYRRHIIKAILYCALILTAFLSSALTYAETQKISILLTVNGAIGPATEDYLHRGLKDAVKKQARLVIIEIDTPGGLDKSMRAIVQHILASPIPVVTYVYPSGARAASAGTYVLYASHIAAMAPGTNLGAATPVQMGGETPAPQAPNHSQSSEKNKPIPSPSAMSQKMTNDAVAYIRSLAELRGRNVEWGEQAVTQASSLSATAALKMGAIDLIADNLPDLLKQLNGRQIKVLGNIITLDTNHLTVVTMQPDWRARMLAIITDPSVAYILLLIGIYGLFFEFANPGFVLPGAAGAISLLLALYAFQLLPINYAGLALIILGLVFLIAELFLSSFGVLGVGGIISFVAGSILLLDTNAHGYTIHWFLIFLMAALSAIFFFLVIGVAIRSRNRRVITGIEQFPGMIGTALADFDHEGWIKVHGETWRARTHTPVKKNQQLKVTKVEGLLLTVIPITKHPEKNPS